MILDVGNDDLVNLIKDNVSNHFGNDKGCPISWEPSGSDFLSPCLQEADAMSRILGQYDIESFVQWLETFMPQLLESDFDLEPGQVLDETDGKLVHLHGVNFSRAWNFYALVVKLVEAAKSFTDPTIHQSLSKMQ